jgi:hypothetical protein
MDLRLANTEPFVQFREFLETLDRNLKVSFGALTLVRQSPPTAQSTAGNHLVQLPTAGEPWGASTKWRNVNDAASDSLLHKSRQIPLLARHVIYAGEVCRFIARKLNQHLVKCLGNRGMALMAAHHSLFTEEPVVRVQVKQHFAETEAVVNAYLCTRYRIIPEQSHEAQKILKSIGQWPACRKRFRELYEKPDR